MAAMVVTSESTSPALAAVDQNQGRPQSTKHIFAETSPRLLRYGLSSFQTTSFSRSPSDGHKLEDVLLVAQEGDGDGGAPSWEPCLFRYEKGGSVSVRVVLDIAAEDRDTQDEVLTLAEPPRLLDVNWSKPFVTAPWTPFQLDEGGICHADSCSTRSHSNSTNDDFSCSISGDSLDSSPSKYSCSKSTSSHFQGMLVYPFLISYTPRHTESDPFAAEERYSLTLAATDEGTREKWMNNLAEEAHADRMMATLAFALERMASFHESNNNNNNNNNSTNNSTNNTTNNHNLSHNHSFHGQGASQGQDHIPSTTMPMTSPFHSADAPDIGLAEYLQRLRDYMGCSIECFVIGLVYIDRLAKQYTKIISPKSVHRLVIAALVLAAKFQDDNIYFNDHYALVGGITLPELNSLECHLLELLHWKLYVSQKEFDLYRELLCCSGRASAE